MPVIVPWLVSPAGLAQVDAIAIEERPVTLTAGSCHCHGRADAVEEALVDKRVSHFQASLAAREVGNGHVDRDALEALQRGISTEMPLYIPAE